MFLIKFGSNIEFLFILYIGAMMYMACILQLGTLLCLLQLIKLTTDDLIKKNSGLIL